MLAGKCTYLGKNFLFVDIPGTYSLMSNSEEEEIARDYICFEKPDVTLIVVDGTCLERNLNLVYQTMEITDNIIVCVNLLDEAKKKGINIDLKKLSELLGCPVVGTVARKKKTLNNLLKTIYNVCTNKLIYKPNKLEYSSLIEKNISILENELKKEILLDNNLYRWFSLKLIDGENNIISSVESHFDFSISNNIKKILHNIYENLERENINQNNFKDFITSAIVSKAEHVCKLSCSYSKKTKNEKDIKIDKILTSKKFGIPIMILFLGLIFWITIIGANYPSELLFNMFSFLQGKLFDFANYIHCPEWLSNMLILGVYQTLTWIISVMLPPMAIFFPLFTFLEDLGYLPRIAFNMDGFFKKCCCTGKQMITMCMGFGCNAAGCVGCRIIDSPRERLIAILTNAFVPCNGRFPLLISIASIFIAGSISGFAGSIVSTLAVICVIILGIFMTLIVSKILSKTILKGMPSSFVLELPPYRKPQVGKILIRSIFDRTLFVLRKSNLHCSSCRAYYLAICKYWYKWSKFAFSCCRLFRTFCKNYGA